MKRYTLIAALILCTCGANAQQFMHLKEDMSKFFISTLQHNYSGTNDSILIRDFCLDYITKYKESIKTQKTSTDFGITIDKRKLEKINKRLRKNNFSAFYYFFAYQTDIENERKEPKKDGLPFGCGLDFDLLNDHRSLSVDFSVEYINELKRNYPEIIDDLAIMGYIPLNVVAGYCLDNKINYNTPELKSYLSLVFWRFLCEQVDIDCC